MPELKAVDLNSITIDGTQMRVSINEEVVAEYAERMGGDKPELFPPVDVYFDGSHYWLADGFHRYHAVRKRGMAKIRVNLHRGTRRDAILHAIGSNVKHGLRRTTADKRKAVGVLLDDDEWAQLPVRTLAEMADVSHTFVANMKQEREVEANDQSDESESDSNGDTSGDDAPSTNEPATTQGGIEEKEESGRQEEQKADDESDESESDADAQPAQTQDAEKPQSWHLAKTFEKQAGAHLRALTAKLREWAGTKDCGEFVVPQLQSVESSLSHIRQAIKFSAPHAMCPCRGEGCELCKGLGWMPEPRWATVPEEMKGDQA